MRVAGATVPEPRDRSRSHFSNVFAAFSKHWPGTSEEEFRMFVQHTSTAFGNSVCAKDIMTCTASSCMSSCSKE